MKRFLFVVVLFGFILICFASCTSKKISTPLQSVNICSDAACPIPPESPNSNVKTSVIINGDNWEFVLPSNGWIPIKGAPEAITKSLINKEKQNIILFNKEPFAGTSLQYYYLALQDVRNSGAHLLSSKNIEINGLRFLEITMISTSGHSKIWNWVTYDNGFGYLFSCGGPYQHAQEEQELCTNIITSFNLKHDSSH